MKKIRSILLTIIIAFGCVSTAVFALTTEVNILNNVDEETPAQVTISGTKFLDNELAEGFKFTLMENGDVISTSISDENGLFSFEPLAFTKPGTYTYTVSEAADEEKNINCDESVYTVIIEVTMSDTELIGELYVSENAEAAQVIFHNATVVFEIEDPEIPFAPKTISKGLRPNPRKSLSK